MDSDLQRKMKELEQRHDVPQYRQLMLLLIMLRFAANAYKAVAFLLTDVEENDKRLPEFVLVVPLINRQIMDLWFILVYLMDDFEPRSLLYEQTAYRELRIQTDVAQATHG